MTHVEGGGVPAGTQLNGIYELESRVAMGGMGEVYVGKVVQTGDKVAIKMILPEHANNELILDLFRKEASTLHNLYHPAIVRYYVFSVDPVLERPYLAMEFADGPALGDRVKTVPLTQQEVEVLLPRIAGGLHEAHEAGIIHRDISPDNVILVDGDVKKAKIIDFGIAKSSNSEGTLIGSGFAGKLKYVSPEQLGLAGGEVTPSADIYALGLVMAEAVIGQPLPMGGTQLEVIDKRRMVPDLSEVPEYLRPLLNWMLQPEPADRPADMSVVAAWRPGDAV
ncbi:MAG: serine/threonine-protein kinase, partial [Pseudomonadota bacterium]